MERIAFFLVVILLSVQVFSQQECAVDETNGCKYYTGNAEKRSITWSGECVDGYVSGKGESKVFENDELIYTYVGNVLKGNLHGQGIMSYKSGHKFEGSFNNGEKEGAGRLDLADGSYYEGNYLAGVMDGQGTYAWPNGQKYSGEWKEGKYHGAGTFTWSNGGTIETSWELGLPGGYAEIHMENGDSYLGNIKGVNKSGGWRFLEDGQGTYIWANQEADIFLNEIEYTGKWKNGQRQGQGELIGKYDSYKGEWKNNFRHGYGEEVSHLESSWRLYSEVCP